MAAAEDKKDKTSGETAKVTTTTTTIFDVALFTPADDVAEEEELSFHGQGLKLNTEDDAKEVAAKISATKMMHVLTLLAVSVWMVSQSHLVRRRALCLPQWRSIHQGPDRHNPLPSEQPRGSPPRARPGTRTCWRRRRIRR